MGDRERATEGGMKARNGGREAVGCQDGGMGCWWEPGGEQEGRHMAL